MLIDPINFVLDLWDWNFVYFFASVLPVHCFIFPCLFVRAGPFCLSVHPSTYLSHGWKCCNYSRHDTRINPLRPEKPSPQTATVLFVRAVQGPVRVLVMAFHHCRSAAECLILVPLLRGVSRCPLLYYKMYMCADVVGGPQHSPSAHSLQQQQQPHYCSPMPVHHHQHHHHHHQCDDTSAHYITQQQQYVQQFQQQQFASSHPSSSSSSSSLSSSYATQPRHYPQQQQQQCVQNGVIADVSSSSMASVDITMQGSVFLFCVSLSVSAVIQKTVAHFSRQRKFSGISFGRIYCLWHWDVADGLFIAPCQFTLS